MRTLARWCFTHRRLVLAGWLLALIAFTGLSQSIKGTYSDNFSLPGTQSTQALDLLQQASPAAAGDNDQLVIATTSGKVTDPAVEQQIAPMLAQVSHMPHVARVDSPYTAAGARQVSSSGQVAFATVVFDQRANVLPKAAIQNVISTAKAAAGNGVRVELGGQAIEQANPVSFGGVGFGIAAAAIVLFLVFGSLLGMVLPLITALVSLGTGLGVIAMLSHTMNMSTFTTQLASLIGLGVGIDYALFIVSRYRLALKAGRTPEEAAVTAVNTSGRAVLFAGITVCIAILGMFALGLNFLYGMAIATSLVVLFTVCASVTLLPAMLGFFGTRVLGRRQRRALAAGTVSASDESPRWGAWARQLKRRPAAFAALGIAVMVIIALPFFSLRLGNSDQGNDPTSTTTRQAYDLLAEGFGPGFNGPLQIVATTDTAAEQAEYTKVIAAISQQPGIAGIGSPIPLGQPGGPHVTITNVYPSTSPQDAATTTLVQHLRTSTIPAATAGTGMTVLVGGQTALAVDFSHVVSGKLPLFIGIVILLSFLLLMVVFRSLLIPLIAAVMNLLSVGAAFGVVTAVFQWGWFASLIGVGEKGPIEAFIPVMVFAILFGLSMDYEVFLVSRMHEEWQRSKDNGHAVTHGLGATGHTITAAAAIMVVVFGSFILGGLRVIKLFGLGLASAVLIDAVVVRSLIVPALMFLLGRGNWAIPRSLDRVLPHLSVESTDGDEEDVAVAEPATY